MGVDVVDFTAGAETLARGIYARNELRKPVFDVVLFAMAVGSIAAGALVSANGAVSSLVSFF